MIDAYSFLRDCHPVDSCFSPLVENLTADVADGSKAGVYDGILVYLLRGSAALRSVALAHPAIAKLQSRWEQHRVAFSSRDGFVSRDGIWAAHGLLLLFPDTTRHDSTYTDAFHALLNSSFGAMASAAVLLLSDLEFRQECVDCTKVIVFLETHRNTPDLCLEILRFISIILPRIRYMDPHSPDASVLDNPVLFAELVTDPNDIRDLAFRLLLISSHGPDGDSTASDLSPQRHVSPNGFANQPTQRQTSIHSSPTLAAVCHHACTHPCLSGMQFVQRTYAAKKWSWPQEIEGFSPPATLDDDGVLLHKAARAALEEEDVELGSAIVLSLLAIAPARAQPILEGPMLWLLERALDEREHLLAVLRLLQHLRPWALQQVATDLQALKKQRRERTPPSPHPPKPEHTNDECDSLRRENAAMFDALERKTRCLEQASACLSTHNALQKERTSLHQSLAFTTQKLNDAEARLTTCESQIERSKASAQTQENLLAELDAQHRRANSGYEEQLRKLEADNQRLFTLVEEETKVRVAAEQRAQEWEQRAGGDDRVVKIDDVGVDVPIRETAGLLEQRCGGLIEGM
eukprot:GEMP01030757.1.p1 GENE.GEMP01030757.1~~GEMP01030757.1.p1  ORF type:complete len:577 (+),score=165.54 GEMP01030757.1:50-1780(+)